MLTGGNGSDTITGGAAGDSFVYTAVTQSTGTARDSITDFLSGADSFSITLDESLATRDLTFDATLQAAAAGTTLVQAGLSGSLGQAIYDTTNSRLIVNTNNDNLVTTLD